MQQIFITEFSRAELQEAPPPPTGLAADEVAGPTLFSVISPGTELNACFLGTNFPVGPGYAAVFRVAETGADVTSLQPGDLALCMGPHCSQQQQKENLVWKLPPALAPEIAGFARLMGVSLTTLVTTRARPPARVAVTGLGIVGNLAAQIFTAAGYRVLGCDPSAQRQSLARQQNLPAVISALEEAEEPWRDAVDLVVECSGHESAVREGCRLVRRGGEVVLVGVPWQQRCDLSGFALLHEVFHRYVTLRGGWEWELPLQPEPFKAGSIRDNQEGALELLAAGRVGVNGLYKLWSPADCQQAYESLRDPQGGFLTAVFDWSRV